MERQQGWRLRRPDYSREWIKINAEMIPGISGQRLPGNENKPEILNGHPVSEC